MHGRVNGEALQLHVVYKKPGFFFTASHARIHIRYYKSCENSYQVLQVTCENPYQVLQVTHTLLPV